MATSKNPENHDDPPPKAGETRAEKPKSSPARKIVLLLLLVATIVVVGLDYLPEGDSETTVVGPPAKKQTPPAQSPAPPQQQQPAAPQQRAPVPTPTPPQYERPPATILVSSSPSDRTAPAPSPQPEAKADQPVSTETARPAESAVAETVPPVDLVAARSPAPSTLPVQGDSELVIVVGDSPSSAQAVARPLPGGPIPTKVNRYARRLLNRYDTNGDRLIDATERRQMQGDPTAIDYSADDAITLDELAAYTANFGRHRRMRLTGSMVEEAVAELPSLYIPTAERDALAAAQAAAQQAAQQAQAVPVALVDNTTEPDGDVELPENEPVEKAGEAEEPEQSQPTTDQVRSKRFVTPKSRLAGLPGWFLAGDTNGDGQLTVAEYAPNSEKARLADFARYDRNNDGVLTDQECPKQ